MKHIPSYFQYLGCLVLAGCSLFAEARVKYIVKDPPEPGAALKIGDKIITTASLIASDPNEFRELKQREWALLKERADHLITETLLGEEAKKYDLSTEDYVNQKLGGSKVKATEKEVSQFAEEKKIPASQLTPELKEKITKYLEMAKKHEIMQGQIKKLTKSTPIEVYFKRPKLELEVPTEGSPSTGKKDSKVHVAVFSDFQCPFCARGAETLIELRKKYASKVHFTFHHLPLPNHPQAKVVSDASMCVYQQSKDGFWKFHDIAFKNQGKLDADSLKDYAKSSGAALGPYEACLAEKTDTTVARDLQFAEKIGIRSTPTFIINGYLVAGAMPFDSFAEIIEDEL